MKTVLITGANKGIGFETARQMAQLGYFVYLGSRDQKNGSEAINQLKAQGISNVELIEIDVTDIDSIKKATQALESKIGALDILINNAGIAGDLPQDFITGSIENLRKIFETNFFGAVQTTQQFIPLLKKSAEPTIVNVSSELGSLTIHSTTDNPNYSIFDAYSSSKTALNSFTVLLANQFKDTNFKINSVTPGYTATDLNQHQGTQTVEQGAAWVVKCATLEGEGRTGKFFREEELPW